MFASVHIHICKYNIAKYPHQSDGYGYIPGVADMHGMHPGWILPFWLILLDRGANQQIIVMAMAQRKVPNSYKWD